MLARFSLRSGEDCNRLPVSAAATRAWTLLVCRIIVQGRGDAVAWTPIASRDANGYSARVAKSGVSGDDLCC